MSQPNQHVKHHLEKNGVDPNSLPDDVIDTMNTCSPDELNAMDKVGKSLEDSNVPPNKAITAVH
jgi:hypothetical protein